MKPLDYDRLSEAYARNRRVHPGVAAALAKHVAEAGVERALDVGCGTGLYSRLLADLGCCCYGLDPAGRMLAESRGQGGGTCLLGRAERLPVADASMDLVLSVDVVHHLGDTAAYFREAWRVLRPGGWVCTVTDSEPIIRARRPLSSHFPETVSVELARYPRLERLCDEMLTAGFEELRQSEVGHSYWLTDISPYRDRAYSALNLIDPEAFARGLARLEADLQLGPVQAASGYTLLWGHRTNAA